jgi:thymidylate synthase
MVNKKPLVDINGNIKINKMNKLDLDYQNLLKDILENGTKKETRNGGTISVFGRQIRHKMSEGFPLLTTKKLHFKSIVVELLWFLRGDTNIKYLLENDCNIWTGDAYKNYCSGIPLEQVIGSDLHPLKNSMIWKRKSDYSSGYPIYERLSQEEFINKIKTDDEFAKKWGSLGKIYGYQWRNWNDNIDQISELIRQLKDNPDSRRMLVSAWNISDLPHQVLPPCHYGFQVYTRELSDAERVELYKRKTNVDTSFFPVLRETLDFHNMPTRAISLMWNQRSCDFPLGIPMNISSYALLLMMIADEVNMIPEELIGNLGDCHIYMNQIDGVKEQIGRVPFELPTVHVRDGIFCSSVNDVILENYQSHPKIYFPLSN